MNRFPFKTRLALLGGCLTIVVATFFTVARPWYLHWGATGDEETRALAGDAIVPNGASQETRAITIDAPIDRVWPWLAQLGQDRGGFYSYDLLENMVGCEMPVDDELRPDRQSWRVGDKLWMYPRQKAGGIGFATLRAYAPGRAMAFGTHMFGTAATAPENGSWAFVLEPVDAWTTRLIVRGRGAPGRGLLASAFDRTIFEPMHFVMERRMMIGIKALGEGRERDRLANHAQVILWMLTFAGFLASAALILLGIRLGAATASVFATAAAFQILTFAQPPLFASAAIATFALTLLAWPAADDGDAIVGSRRPAVQRP